MKLLTFVIILLFSTLINAQQLDKGAYPFNAIGKVTEELPIRKAPPHGFLNLFLGKKIKTLNKDTEVEIIGIKMYGGFKGTHIWYQLINTDASENENVAPWWIYAGEKIKGEHSSSEKALRVKIQEITQ